MPDALDEMALQLDAINYYPRPLVYAYHCMDNKAKTQQNRLDGLLDCAEALSHTLATIVLGLYLRQPKTERDTKRNQEIFQTIFVKDKLSLGGWVGLAIGTTKRLDPDTPECSEMLAFLLDYGLTAVLSRIEYTLCHSCEGRNSYSRTTGFLPSQE